MQGSGTTNCGNGDTINIVAQKTATTVNYAINYDGNASDVSNVPRRQTGSTTTGSWTTNLSTSTPTRTNYQFNGWNTNRNGNGTSYAPGASVTLQAASPTLNLYAQWARTYQLTVQTDPTGGQTTGSGRYTAGSQANISASAPSNAPSGQVYKFVGWSSTAGTFASATTSSTTFTMPSNNITVTASFELRDDKNGNGVADEDESWYNVTYTDGVDDEVVFADQSYNVLTGMATPQFEGDTPQRTDYVFAGWDPQVAETVTQSVEYKAIWKDDKNNNGVADEDEETHYTVTYTDGVDDEVVFTDELYENLVINQPTPAFSGGTPQRTDYVFAGWDPQVAETVTQNVEYKAIWKDDKNNNDVADEDEEWYDVVYTDGVDDEVVFADQSYNVLTGMATPQFEGGTPQRTDYVFAGWDPQVAETVTESVEYKAIWKDDKNNNDEADEDEKVHYTVSYTDGVDDEVVFADEVYENLVINQPTPAFSGGTPQRTGYVFLGWEPTVTETVEDNASYVAVWAEDKNNNGQDDELDDKYTITYTDGVDNEEIFADQVYSDVLVGMPTPAFVLNPLSRTAGDEPQRTGYVFAGWDPALAETVTATVDYAATWKVDSNNNGVADEDEVTITLSYDANGGTNAPAAQSMLVAEGERAEFVLSTATPSRNGYVFMGWSQSKTGSAQFKAGERVLVAENVTLYAVWAKPTDAPKTGDDSNIALWAALAGLSVMATGAALVLIKKKSFGK